MRLPSITHIAFSAAVLAACSSPTSTVKPDAPPVTIAEPTPAPAAPSAEIPADAGAGMKMALIVSFYSPGNGTNAEASAKLDAIVAAAKPAPVRKSVRWGREGEHDECFKLDDLSAEQKTAFIAQVEKELGKADRVNILKDQPCKEAW